MSPRMVWSLHWIQKLQGCALWQLEKKPEYQQSSEHHERLAGLDTPQRLCPQRRPAAAQESPMKTLSSNGPGRTFPLDSEVTVAVAAQSVALRKQCVQESRVQGVATIRMQRRTVSSPSRLSQGSGRSIHAQTTSSDMQPISGHPISYPILTPI